MQKKTFEEIEKEYDLELDRIVKTIKKEKAKTILLQFPDGMKPYSTTIAEEISKKTKTTCLIWFGSCFGACDLPAGIDSLKPKIDLIIQFGHSPWNYSKRKDIKVLK
jgi:2-(3-amino-3-carboxypropyl)histidine synthase